MIRTEWAVCQKPPCGKRFQRPIGETYATCLSCQTAERLTAAGITPDDPGLRAIAIHNEAVLRQS
jgi:hypothetical protein